MDERVFVKVLCTDKLEIKIVAIFQRRIALNLFSLLDFFSSEI